MTTKKTVLRLKRNIFGSARQKGFFFFASSLARAGPRFALPVDRQNEEAFKIGNDDVDGNENGKKSSFAKRKTTLNVQQAFLFISLPSLHDHDVKFPHGAFYGGGKHKTTMFSSYFYTWIRSPIIQFLENSLTKDILSKSE